MKCKAQLMAAIAMGFLASGSAAIADDGEGSSVQSAERPVPAKSTSLDASGDADGLLGGWARWCDFLPVPCIRPN